MKNFYVTETLTITGGGEDAVELEVETEVEVDYHIEPGQNGGMTDPSWSASAHIEDARRAEALVIAGVTVAAKGGAVHLTDAECEEIEGEILEHLGEP